MEKQLIKIYCDGGARGNPGPGAAAFVAEKEGSVIYKDSKYLGEVTNNTAEYQAVLLAWQWIVKEKISGEIIFILDSQLVANQLSGNFKIKNDNLRNYFFSIKELEKTFSSKISYTCVAREKNKLADQLVNQTLDSFS